MSVEESVAVGLTDVGFGFDTGGSWLRWCVGGEGASELWLGGLVRVWKEQASLMRRAVVVEKDVGWRFEAGSKASWLGGLSSALEMFCRR